MNSATVAQFNIPGMTIHKTMTEAQHTQVEKILSRSLDHVYNNLTSPVPDGRGLSHEQAMQAIADYRQFMVGCVFYPGLYMFALLGDYAWHADFERMLEYLVETQDIYGYVLIHRPIDAAHSMATTAHSQFRKAMYDVFGLEEVPKTWDRFWDTKPKDCISGCCHDLRNHVAVTVAVTPIVASSNHS